MSAWNGLLGALAGCPSLPAAACRNKSSLYDLTAEATHPGPVGAAEVAEARTEALRLCNGCPGVAPCAAWVQSLPRSRRPLGVVGGRLYLGPGTKSRATQPTEGLTA